MNTFAFNPREKFAKHYASLLKRIKKNDHMWDVIKVGSLLAALVFFMFIYLYFVSLASTRGYFLRQAMQRRTTISFQQEIIKTQLLKIRQESREKMRDPSLPINTRNTNTQVTRIVIPAPTSNN